MIAHEKKTEVKQAAEHFYANAPDWAAFYRETIGPRGVVRRVFPSREELAAFEQSEDYEAILLLLTKLREQGPLPTEDGEPTRVITVRMPKSMHEALRGEAFDRHTSMNKLCISKLLQFIDGDKVPTEPSLLGGQ